MKYKIYSAEYKLLLIEEFQSRKISMRVYCREKDVPLNTFISWIKKVKILGKEELFKGDLPILVKIIFPVLVKLILPFSFI